MANLLQHDYLSKRMCKGLSSYKYQSSGLTWLDDLHDPMWNYCVSKMPTWLAPNLITLSGTMFIVAAHLLFIAYAPELDGENAPWWVHAFAGCAILLYVNLDCMDGKQARRTGSSSPLGQLFDHGCDAFVTGIMIINVAASVGLRLSAPMILMMFAPLMLWMMSQWEEYHTGQMMYGNGVYGVLEANYAFAITHFVSAALGSEWWHKRIGAVVPGLPPRLGQLEGVMVFFYVAMVFIGYQMAVQAYSVFTAKQTMDARERGYKELGAGNALKHLLYMSLFFALAYLYLNQDLKSKGQFEGRWLLETVSLAYSQLATQIIIAHMAKDAYVPAWAPYAALALGLLNARLDVVDQGLLAKGILATVLIGYLHFVVCVCMQVARHLDINIMTIKPSD